MTTLQEIQDKQRMLDEAIHTRAWKQPEETIMYRIEALSVEIAEMHNEARTFKYWAQKPAMRAKVIEEAVDVLHFIASIANQWECKLVLPPVVATAPQPGHCYLQLQQRITDLVECMESLQMGSKAFKEDAVFMFMVAFVTYLHAVGICPQVDVLNNYVYKHHTNILRQKNGY
jgi:dimeric dUTPase (all-alpha-NTP-PPase superfamily)